MRTPSLITKPPGSKPPIEGKLTWLWVKTNGIPFPGSCTTHVRTYFSGWIESDVHWGPTDSGLTHGMHSVFSPSAGSKVRIYRQARTALGMWKELAAEKKRDCARPRRVLFFFSFSRRVGLAETWRLFSAGLQRADAQFILKQMRLATFGGKHFFPNS